MSLKEGTTKLHKLNSDLMFESDWFGYCDEAYDLTDDKLIIFENETFGIQSQNWTISKDAFCLYANQFSSDFPKQIFLVLHKPCEYQNGQKVDLEQNVVAISLICNALTIAVYIFVYKKRNIINKCFMCYIACMSLHHLLWLLTRYGNLVKESCTSAGYARYFFASACILWLFVISHKIRVGLLSINKNEHRNLFALYNAIVWGISGMATTVIFLIDHFWGADLSSYKWTPAIGFFQCWFNPNDWSILIYYIGPILILNVVNWFMFVLTATQIFKVHRNVKKWIISNPKSDRNT
ncbi:probable G-protein coupled receptor Mth-like 6 [Drosophila subpulchrella]|uniref:probable G-protein coupled receptor Mth-like 6 n=1 Tax=Drosophila subpulchrella TaxID=1486046 RepID=UPI0018A1393A|nr:probable G-protein coupled receptor Mth-like 6 [Drosophila subpulchrella]